KERISLGVDLMAIIRVECGTQEVPTLTEHTGIALAQLLEQLGRPLDIGEEECHCSRRKVRTGGYPVPGFGWVSRGQERKRLSRCLFPPGLLQGLGKVSHGGKAVF